MISVKEVIVVEGRYDKNTLSQVFDAVIVETSGFGLFKDREKLALLRRLAEKRGLVVLTDSDGAGFVIRNYLKSVLPKQGVFHAYIPDVPGKERRKDKPGKEGKLGVEGMRPEVLLGGARRRARADGRTPAEHEEGSVLLRTFRRRRERQTPRRADAAAGASGASRRKRLSRRAESADDARGAGQLQVA